MADTVAATISSVSTTFRENGLKNPILDDNNEKSIYIQRQLRGYRNQDPPPDSQQCLPLSIFKTIFSDRSTLLSEALGQLTAGALFFACRSCEYSKVPNDESRKTKTLRLKNLKFFKNFNELKNPNRFHSADFIQITFEMQKTEIKHQSIIQHKASGEFCPVKIWASIKKRILSYPGSSENSKVNLFLKNGKLVEITSKAIRLNIKHHVRLIDPTQKFYKLDKIGTHSIRSSTAMILHCVGVDVPMIKLLGRWASDAFLRYIRHQLADFSKNISNLMVNSKDNFFNVPTSNIRTSNDSSSNSQIQGPAVPNPKDQKHYTKIFNLWK